MWKLEQNNIIDPNLQGYHGPEFVFQLQCISTRSTALLDLIINL